MKLIFAPDSFKGSLRSGEEIAILKCVAEEIFPGCDMLGIPLADGGEGSAEVLAEGMELGLRSLKVQDPLGKPVLARYLLMPDGTAFIESAEASGLKLVPPASRDPETSSSYGTGELMKDALDHGARRLLIDLAGTAANDGGMGAMAALGARFVGENGRKLKPLGENLGNVVRVDLSRLDRRLRNTEILALWDEDIPLCGENGTTYCFGAQRGGSETQLLRLETGMERMAALMEGAFGIPVRSEPGAGAGGGLAAALTAFCGARLASGSETLLKLVDFDEKLNGADLIVSGEGCLDSGSLRHRILRAVCEAAAERRIPVMALVGSVEAGAEEIRPLGLKGIYPLARSGIRPAAAMARASALYEQRARELLTDFREKQGLGLLQAAEPEPESEDAAEPKEEAANIIFCFSGTGNSLDVALHLAAGLGDTRIVSLRDLPEPWDCSRAERVGFVYSCREGGLPENVERYARELRLPPDCYRFAVETYGKTPGSGLGRLREQLSLDYWAEIRCPDHDYRDHLPELPGLGESPESLLQKARAKADTMAVELRYCRRLAAPRLDGLGRTGKRLLERARVRKTPEFRVNYRCVGCGRCFDLCPTGNINLSGGIPHFGKDCIGCMGCAAYCPQGALEPLGGRGRKPGKNPDISPEQLRQRSLYIP